MGTLYEDAMMARPRQNLYQRLSRLVGATYAAFTADSCRAFSAALVYYNTLSVIPLVVLIFTLPGLLLGLVSTQATERLTGAVGSLFGPEIGAILAGALARFQSQSMVVAAVSLGALLYSASSGFRFLRYAFRRIWSAELQRPAESRVRWLRKTLIGRVIDNLISFGMVLAAPLVALAGILLYILALFASAELCKQLVHDHSGIRCAAR